MPQFQALLNTIRDFKELLYQRNLDLLSSAERVAAIQILAVCREIASYSQIDSDRLIEMAKNGERKPSKRAHSKEHRRLAEALQRHKRRDDEVFKEIYQLRPDWFGPSQSSVVEDNKKKLLEIARTTGVRPDLKTAESRRLSDALRRYLYKAGCCYDAEFDREIHILQPGWFDGQRRIENMRRVGLSNRKSLLGVEMPSTSSRVVSLKGKYTCNGETLTIKEWAEKLGYDVSGIRWRLRRHPPEIALAYSKGSDQVAIRAKKIAYAGEILTVLEWAEKLGYKLSTMHQRLREKPLEEALVPFGSRKQKPVKSTERPAKPLGARYRDDQEIRERLRKFCHDHGCKIS